jgi:hypothetical protein
MSGFRNESSADNKAEVVIYKDEVEKLLRKYKKIKKYMKSPLFAVKSMDGTEEYVSKLVEEAEENPL